MGLAACGGSDEPVATSTGVALKGPLQNALAFVDANGNFIKDAGETSTMTDATGSYTLENPNGHAIVIQTTSNTIDTSSGAQITGLTLAGSSTDSVITPFTTIAVKNPDADLDAIATAMGLPGVDLATFNPYADGADTAQALAYEKSAQQVVSLLTVAGSALQASGNGTEAAAFTAVFDALAVQLETAVANGTTLDLKDSTLLTTIVNDAATTLGVDAATVAAVAGQVGDLNTAIGNVTSLAAADAADAFSASTDLADVYDTDSTTAANISVADVIGNEAPTDITLSANGVNETIEGDAAPTQAIEIGALTVADIDGASGDATLALSGADGALFEIVDGVLFIKAGTEINFEAQSTYSITVTATDTGGATFAKNLTVEVGNVDENGDYLEYEVTGAPVVGMTLTLSGELTDPDNLVNGGAADDFASVKVEWFADEQSVKVETFDDQSTADEASLVITEDMAGKDITANVSYVDQSGFSSEFDAIEFGEAIPDSAPINIEIFADAEASVDTFITGFDGMGDSLQAMTDVIGSELAEFNNGVDAYLQNNDGPSIEVSSSGITAIWGDYRLSGEFTDFAPTTLAGLQAAAGGFDSDDPSTWTIDGGFNAISFEGPNGSLFALQFENDNDNGSGKTYDILRLVNQNAETDPNAENGTVNEIGLLGAFDNQISSVLDLVAGLADVDADIDALYDAHYEVEPEWNPNPTPEEYEEYNAAFNQWVDGFDAIVVQENGLLVEYFTSVVNDYDLDGFYVGVKDGADVLNVKIDRAPDEDGTNVITIGGQDQTIAIWGTFPTTAVDMVQTLEYLSEVENFDQNYDAIMSDLAEFGFEGIEGFGLYDGDQDASIRVTIEDFELAASGDIEFDLEGDIGYEYQTEDDVTNSVIHDDNGQYQFTGEGIDLATLEDLINDEVTPIS